MLEQIFVEAVEGKRPWSDVFSKMKSLFVTDVVNPLEAFGKQFESDFGKVALAEAGTYGPQIANDLISGNASQIPVLIPVIAAKLEADGIKIAETDAAQDANQIIGNALRVQGTASALTPAAIPAAS